MFNKKEKEEQVKQTAEVVKHILSHMEKQTQILESLHEKQVGKFEYKSEYFDEE